MKLRNKKNGEILDDVQYRNFSLHDGFGFRNEDGKEYYYHSLAELTDEWEDVEEPKAYWFIRDDDSGVGYSPIGNSSVAKRREAIGNYFETKEEAEKAVEKLKALKRLKDHGFKFVGKTYETDTRFGSAFYQLNEDTYSEDVMADLDLLFGTVKLERE